MQDGNSKIKDPWKLEKLLAKCKNKEELFQYLSDMAVKASITGGEIYVIRGASVLPSDINADLNILSTCNLEEADTRVILHTLDTAR